MKLSITTPMGIVVDNETVLSLKAEDKTGSFGIMPVHADFITVLDISVISWQGENGKMNYCAVCKGLLSVTKGREILIATREAVIGTDLESLKSSTLVKYYFDEEQEEKTRVSQEIMQAEAIKNIQKYLLQETRFDTSP